MVVQTKIPLPHYKSPETFFVITIDSEVFCQSRTLGCLHIESARKFYTAGGAEEFIYSERLDEEWSVIECAYAAIEGPVILDHYGFRA